MLFPVIGNSRQGREASVPDSAKHRQHLLIGGSGVVGTVLTERLIAHRQGVLVVDPVSPRHPDAVWIAGDDLSPEAITDLVLQADVVAFLATGANNGWEGLLDTEIRGLVAVVEACVSHPKLNRLIFASSNHAVGGYELDVPEYGVTPPYEASAPVRPDGLYGAAKCFGEGMCRTAAELFSLPVSVLRIGTMRTIDDVDHHVGEPGFGRYGSPDEIRSRLRRSWLTHSDLWRIYTEEIEALETFRLRFATSSPGALWSGSVESWMAPPENAGGVVD